MDKRIQMREKQPLPLLLPRLLGREQIRMRREVIDHLRKDRRPCRIDFSRARDSVIASSGRATSMSFFFGALMVVTDRLGGRHTPRSR
jgi:hypothetical protein